MTKTTTVFSSTKQKISIICTLILLLLGLLYAFSPMLIGLLLERQLKHYGITSSSRMEHPGSDQLKLAAAHFTIDRPEFQGQITVTELSLKYNWLDLLLRQKIKQIHIRKLDIQLSDNRGQAAPSVSTEFALAALLPATLLSEVAINQLQIETLQLSWDKNPQQQIAVIGELLLNPEQLRLRGDYFENDTLLGSLQTEFNAENQFLIKGQLLAQHPPQNQAGNQSYFNFQLEGDIQATAGKINIRARQRINFKQFKLQSFWLSPLLTPSQLQQLSSLEAQLQLNHQFSMPLAVTDNWLAQLQADIGFDLQIAQRQLKLPLADKSLSAAKIKLSSSGTLRWSQRQLAIEMHPSTNIEISDFNGPQSHSERINISLRSALKLSFDRQFRINKIPSFTASIDASPWRTSIGEFNHLPLTINVRQADLLKRLLAVDFQLQKLNLDNSQAQIRLPFQQLSSSIQGHFSLQQNKLKLSLQEGLTLAISQLSNAGSSTVKTSTMPDGNRAQAAEYFTEQLKVTTDSAINLSLDITDNFLEVADSAFTVQPGKWQSPVGQIEHQAIKLRLSNIDLLRNSARLTFDLKQVHLQASKLPFKQALLSATGTFEFTPEQINLKLRKKMRLQLQKIATAELRTSALTIHNTKEITLKLPLTAAAPNLAKLQVSAINLHLTGATLRAAQQKFSYRSANLAIPKLQLAPLQLQLYTKVRGFSLLKNNLVQNLDINSQASVAGNRYRANFEINHNALPLRLKGKIRSDSKFRHISGEWQLSPLSLASAARKMAELSNLPWPEELQIIAGDYRHSGQFKITKQKIEAQVQHKVTQLTLKIADTIARDINISSDSQYKDSRLSETGSLNIAEVNSGIAVTQISADFSLKNILKTNRSLQLNNTKGKLLQGDFNLEPFSTTLEPLQGSSQINFSNLPLNNVLALEQNPSLSGSGSLQGKLPFRFSSGQLYIVDGQIKAMDKGYIRYSANDRIRALASTNSGLKIALNILEDFYYEVLSIRLSYYPDGKLVLENQLSGNNPNWQQGHPIKFSINVEENLLALLKTLQFSSDLEKNIRQQIQKTAQ